MISVSSTAIMVLMEDGSKKNFDSERANTTLLEASKLGGIKESWLAEDITNALEHALLYQAEREILFSEREINIFIEKMLSEAGYRVIAQRFRSLTRENVFVLENETVSRLLKTNIGMTDDEALLTASNVIDACDALGIKQPPSGLILEFGKYYRNATPNTLKIHKAVNIPKNISNILRGKIDVIPHLSKSAAEKINYGIFNIGSVSTLFPAIKVDLFFEKIATYNSLDPVLTELVFFPFFDEIAEDIDETISATMNNFNSVKNQPVYLRFSDIYSFCEKYFGVKFPEGNSFCNELTVAFTDVLKHKVIIKGLRTGSI